MRQGRRSPARARRSAPRRRSPQTTAGQEAPRSRSRCARRRRSARRSTIKVTVEPVPRRETTEQQHARRTRRSSRADGRPARRPAAARLAFAAVDDLTRPPGIVALAARRGRRDRAGARVVLARPPAPPARRAARPCSATGEPRPGRARREPRTATSARCTTRSRTSPTRSTGGMDVAEDRLDGAIAYRALVRYDAYNEMSGHQSTSIALLDARRDGVVLSSIHHRDQARLYAKQVRDGRGRDRAVARGGRGGPARARQGDRAGRRLGVRPMRVGYLGPEGTFSHEALLAAPARRRTSSSALPDAARRDHGRPRRHGRPRVRADRELARGLGQRDARHARRRDRRRRASSASVVHRRAPLPDRARASRRSTRSRRSSRTRRPPRSARASCATRLPRRAGARRPTRPPTRCAWSPSSSAPWAALGNRLSAELYGCEILRAGRRGRAGQRDALRLARAARRATPAGTARGRRRSSSGARATSRPGWLVALPVRVRLPRREPDEDRVAAAQAGPRPLHVLRRPRGRARPTPRSPGARGAARRRPSEVRVLGSYPAASVGRARLRGADRADVRPLHSRHGWP